MRFCLLARKDAWRINGQLVPLDVTHEIGLKLGAREVNIALGYSTSIQRAVGTPSAFAIASRTWNS
ncbi:hypothetical protein GNAINCEL_00064 [Serratia phage KKP 3709]|nr:hypothetical protein GNAINCEL_00064 [Serratia phage KKP 3709]